MGEVKDWVPILSVLAALTTLIFQQWRIARDNQKKDRRTANKLKILYLCQTEGLSESLILERYKKQHPLDLVDEVEIRKTIYEMLADQTLVFIADTETYEVRSHLPRKSGKAWQQTSTVQQVTQQQQQQQQ